MSSKKVTSPTLHSSLFAPNFLEQWHCGARPQLQRRDHAGFTPASLHPFRNMLEVTIRRPPLNCQLRAINHNERICHIKY